MRQDFDPLAEQAFLDRCQQGRSVGMTELSQRLTCVRRMLRGRNRIMGFPLTTTELDDVEQDTVVTVLRRLPSFRPLAPFEAWVYGICCLLLRDAVRTKRRQADRQSELDEETQEGKRDVGDFLADWSEVEAVLQRLGGIEAEIVRLKHLEDLTFEEIASRVALAKNTIKSHYYRGMARIRALVQEGGERDARF